MIVTPAAVIFDCDGVLVDSEPIMNREFCVMLNELGLAYTPESAITTFMGRTMKSCLAILERDLGGPVPDDFLTRLEERAYAAFRRELTPVAGITTVLDALDTAGIPFAVASSGSHQKMHTTLGITGLLDRLRDKLTSGTEVANGKPAPDVFLLAAERLGHAPDSCLVIEDSLLGIEAARAAEMQVIGYAAMMSANDMHQRGATVVVTSMLDIPALLQLA